MSATPAIDKTAKSKAPRQTHAERRERAEHEMLSAAARLVAQKGVAGLQLNDVGEAAGYSRGLPAHYFGKKDNLVARLGEFIVERFQADMARTATQMDFTGIDAVLIPADFYLKSVERHPARAQALQILLIEARNHPDLLSAILELNKASLAAYETRLRKASETGEIRADIDPESEAVLILGMLRGTAALWLADQGGMDMAALRATARETLKRSLAP